ncbi:MAG: hypothetical protein Q7S75_03565 [bacterium]|nr:hypothetical protein [bacterium]
MDWKLFWQILAGGIALVVIQGIASWVDHRFSQAQLVAYGITNSWSFKEHGGMWADIFIISPIVAYAISNYRLEYSSIRGLVSFVVTTLVVLALIESYRRGGIKFGDHCTHDGKTVFAGWIHGIFAVAAIWVCAQIYLGWTTPSVSKVEIVFLSIVLTPFFYLGVAKFSELWVFDSFAKWQVASLTIGLWLIAGIRLWRTW